MLSDQSGSHSADDVLLESTEGLAVPLLSGLSGDLEGGSNLSPSAAIGAGLLGKVVDAKVEEAPLPIEVDEAGDDVVGHVSSVLDDPPACQGVLTDQLERIVAREKAAALRKAADAAGKFRVAVYAPGHHEVGKNMRWANPVADWLRERADRIEAGS